MEKENKGMNIKKYDIIALGEVLVDMSQCGISERNNAILEASAGGAPANMLSMASKLGSKCAFIGKVGDDYLGHELQARLEQQGIDCNGLVYDKRYATTIAFVHIDDSGNRSFSFCRKPGADAMLETRDIRKDLIENATFFHFGTVSFSSKKACEATKEAIKIAKKAGCFLSFDVNIRHNMWEDETELNSSIDFGMKNCNVLKVSDEEIIEILNIKDVEKAAAVLAEKYPNIDLIFVTCGEKGTYIKGKDFSGKVRAMSIGKVIDTTGAGDTFFGTCIHFLAQNPKGRFEPEYVIQAARYGSAASGLIVARMGSMSQMPSKEEVEQVLALIV